MTQKRLWNAPAVVVLLLLGCCVGCTENNKSPDSESALAKVGEESNRQPTQASAFVSEHDEITVADTSANADPDSRPPPNPTTISDDVAALSTEIHGKGWIAYSAPAGNGSWEIFVMRPDGSGRHKITNTHDYNEAGVRFSPDGGRILYYRVPKEEPVDNNNYGTFELVVANADGSNPVSYGNEIHWASWSPDGATVIGLGKHDVQYIDLATRNITKKIPRTGLVQQLSVSPDGKWVVGTANGLGPYWNIGRLKIDDAVINSVSETDRYNCTPDWMPDSKRVIYSRGIIPEKGGRAELWIANGAGGDQQMLYAETERHVYGACAAPDGEYLIFTRSSADMGGHDSAGAQMSIIRFADAPIVGEQDATLRKQYPEARHGPRLDLGEGWEPHWTHADISPQDLNDFVPASQ